jgi:hypothetical protein
MCRKGGIENQKIASLQLCGARRRAGTIFVSGLEDSIFVLRMHPNKWHQPLKNQFWGADRGPKLNFQGLTPVSGIDKPYCEKFRING